LYYLDPPFTLQTTFLDLGHLTSMFLFLPLAFLKHSSNIKYRWIVLLFIVHPSASLLIFIIIEVSFHLVLLVSLFFFPLTFVFLLSKSFLHFFVILTPTFILTSFSFTITPVIFYLATLIYFEPILKTFSKFNYQLS